MDVFPYYRQLDAMDCGPTCLRMIAKFYGKSYSLQTLRARSFISRNGVSMLGISDAAESIGFRTSGVRVSFEQLAEDVPLPCILHWNQSHFVVCYDVKKKKGQYSFRIADPATQLVTYNELELKRCWLATKSDGEEKDNRMQYVVSFRPRVSLMYALFIGKLYIDYERLSFTRAEFGLDMANRVKAVEAILHKKPVGLRFRPQEVTYLVTYKQQGAKTYLNYIRNVIRFKCDWKKRLFSSSYTAFSEMVVTDRTESPLSGISNKNTFKRKQVFYDLVDEYWNEDFWRNYNIIEPTESLENAVCKLRKQSN